MHSGMGDGDLIWAATMFQVPPSHSLHPDQQVPLSMQQPLHLLCRATNSTISTPVTSPSGKAFATTKAVLRPPVTSPYLLTFEQVELLVHWWRQRIPSQKKKGKGWGSGSESEAEVRTRKRKPRMKMNEWSPQSQESLKNLQRHLRLTILLENPFVASNEERVRTVTASKALRGEVAVDEEQIRHLMSWVSSYRGHFARVAKNNTRNLWKIPTGYNNDDSIDKAEEMYGLFERWRLRFHYADADLKNNRNARPDELTEPFLSPAFNTKVQRMIFDSPAWVDAIHDSVDFDDKLPPSTLALVGTAIWHEFSQEMKFYEVLGGTRNADKAKKAAAKVQFTPETYNRVYGAFLQRTSRLSADTLSAINRAASDQAEEAQEHEGESDMLDYGTLGTGQSWPKDVFAANRMQGWRLTKRSNSTMMCGDFDAFQD
ncbi:hypothetical protein BT69DRAFT_1319889 [Atractiella rhizophila]|nr:hypothetical protein BT69DRAFT_1319889 [Atractiella rhizophila]